MDAAISISMDLKSVQEQIKSLTREAVEVVKAKQPEIAGKISVPLKSLVQEDFNRKSRLATGAGNIKWKDILQRTKDRKNSSIVGIDTGELYDSLRVTTRGGSEFLTISFESEHAEFFDEKRKLLPETDVQQWVGELEPYVEEVVTRALQRVVDGQ